MTRLAIACRFATAVSVLVLGIGCSDSAPPSKAGANDDSKEPPAAKTVKDQSAAIDEARQVDLPLLGEADKALIEEADPAGKGRRVTLTKANEINEITQALKPRGADPSAGEIAATVTFYRGASVLRKVWVYDGGEWGFERPGTSWTTGREAELWKIIQEHLK